MKELKQFAQEDIVLVIAGNKSDMESQREVKKDVGEELGRKEGAMHFLTSAKSGSGIREMFGYMANSKEFNFYTKQFLRNHFFFVFFL